MGAASTDDAAADVEILQQSGWVLREHAIAEWPFDVRWSFEAGAVTVPQLEPLTRSLGAITLADLLDMVAEDRIRDRWPRAGSGCGHRTPSASASPAGHQNPHRSGARHHRAASRASAQRRARSLGRAGRVAPTRTRSGRRPAALDYARLFEAALETRTVLEIDGGASHVDLDATLAAAAAVRGVTLSIDSDAHAVGQLGRYMQAGVERRLVLNIRPLPEIRALIAAKRSRFPV